MTRFSLEDGRSYGAWLREQPRALVLFRGLGCPYSATFEKVFQEEPVPEGWAVAVREVEEGGSGPVGESLLVHVTPTIAAYTRGEEAARLPGKLFIGITRAQYRRFLRELR